MTGAALEDGGAVSLSLPPQACAVLFNELPHARSLDSALRLIDSVRQRQLGDGLLTVNLDMHPDGPDAETIELQRLWSSNPDAYPAGGRKRKTMTAWTRQLLRHGELFVGEGDSALQAVFDDHERIRSLGLHAVVNVPLFEDGRCRATFNVLGRRRRWAPGELAIVQLLALLATPWVFRAAARA